MTKIRPSTDADIGAMTAIYAHHVLHGTGTFEITPPTEADMAGRRADVLSKGLPYLVLEDGTGVIGFAYCNWFKPRPAYRFSAEDSIYLAPAAAGRGLGRLLLQELMAQAERAGVRKLIAVIGDSANQGSIGVHRSCGFQSVGILSACGWKFERWLDVVLMERFIGAGNSTPAADAAK
ncbi:N-acetyltransferase family protein [Rhodoferax sp.]|uniref:GNAT family N-acetyltransferase n=1 Tax=Rhodoferax sp. TaxID=50421 RepID=UPI002ACD31D6|nr:N-acetyltransferase family protein [Rhodoferax sp.]MDZ7921645.1 N-acetyltransferase family protein [Rhodoferax sp.]